jgi:ABC-type Zn2+ transport system substrate-binding protein/surface adhesin
MDQRDRELQLEAQKMSPIFSTLGINPMVVKAIQEKATAKFGELEEVSISQQIEAVIETEGTTVEKMLCLAIMVRLSALSSSNSKSNGF